MSDPVLIAIVAALGALLGGAPAVIAAAVVVLRTRAGIDRSAARARIDEWERLISRLGDQADHQQSQISQLWDRWQDSERRLAEATGQLADLRRRLGESAAP